jgi:ADP-dependent glucokinase
MAQRFLIEKTEVLLAATMSEKQKTHLINGIDFVDFKPTPDFVDDIHLILEYRTNDVFGEHKAPRANRYILHSDSNNPMLMSLELLKPSAMKGDLFVVSGLQMMDNFPFATPSLRSERLNAVKKQMTSLDKETLTHFEMASFVEIELLNDLAKYILPYSNSLGCNEQEIDNLVHVLETGRISLVANSNPRVATTLDQMRRVFKIVNRNYFAQKEKDTDARMLTRIHIHTLAFQLVLNVKDSKWKNIKSSAAKSSLVAHRHVCQAGYVNPENAILILDDSFSTSAEESNETDVRPKRIDIKKASPGISCWMETLGVDLKNTVEIKICIAPNLVCRNAKKTVGAGDNISASGLAVQL